MKKYRQLIRELPSKKVVFAFGRFQPPGKNHGLVFAVVKHLASAQGADHIIYASRSQDKKSNPLPVDRKVYWLNRMFPKTNFVGADDSIRTFIEVAKHLNKKYKNLVMVAGSDRVLEFQTLLDKYNNKEFNYDTIEVVSAGERDPDSEGTSGMSGTKMRDAAKNSDAKSFKKGLPSTVTTIDAKRLMNELREHMGLEVVKEDISFDRNELREQYLRGEVFLKGEFVQDDAGTYEIVDRGTNYLTVVNESGELLKKWIHMVHVVEVIAEDIPISYAPKEITFKGYTTKNLHHSPDATKAFQATIERLNGGLVKDPVAVLNALKSTDTYMRVNDMHLLQGKSPDETELASWNAAHAKAKDSLERTGEYLHHMDYWKQHENELQGMLANYTPATAGADMNDSYNPTGNQITESAARFIEKVNQAAKSAASGNHKNAKMHLDNARTFMLGVKSTDMGKITDAHGIYKNLRKKYSGSGGDYETKDNMVGNAKITNEELSEMKFNSSDKIKVARVIATALGITDVDKMSNPAQLVNNGLRKIRNKPMRPEYVDVIHHMLQTATEAGIEFDPKLVPNKVTAVPSDEVVESAAHKLVATKLKNIQSLKDFSANTVRPKVQTFVAREFQKDKKEVAEGKCGASKKKMKEEVEDLEESVSELDKHISSFRAGVKTSDSKHTVYKKDGKPIPNSKHVETDAPHQDIFNHLTKLGYKKPSGYDSHPDKFDMHHNSEEMTSSSSPMHAKTGVMAHISTEHGSKTKVHFTHNRMKNEEVDLEEAHKIHDKVEIIRGSDKGIIGRIGEIRHGLYKGAPKTYTVYHGEDGATRVSKEHIRGIKEETDLDEGSEGKYVQQGHKVPRGYEMTAHGRIVKKGPGPGMSNKGVGGDGSGARVSKLAKEETDLEEDAKPTHMLTVTVSDPNHTMVSKRKETIMKKATVKATDEHSAIERVKQHYRKAGYKVHDVIHAGLKEDTGMSDLGRKLLTLNPNANTKTTALPSDITKAKAKAKLKSITPDDKVNDSDIESDAIKTAEPEAVMGMHMVSPYASNSLRKMKINYATHSEAFDPFFNDGAKNNIIDEDDETHLDSIDDAELDKMANDINHEDDILDAYDDHELGIIDDETGEEIEKDVKEELETMNEVLSRSERLKAKVRFARSASKRARKTKLALKSRSSAKTLNSRARKLAVNLLKKRIARKPLDKLTLGEKERIEKIISKKKVLVNRLAMRLVSRVKKIETDRLSHKKYTK